jgi:beta-lactamase class D
MIHVLLFYLSLTHAHALSLPKDLAPVFNGNTGCLIIRNIKTGVDEVKFGGKFCEERVYACSTFKVPIALMAIDRGLIEDEKTFFRWDGNDKGMEFWNRDQTAQSWISDSVVWISQLLTPKLGMPAIQDYLKDFGYGNQDMSGGITKAWLSSTLKISPNEQVSFLRRLWNGELKVSEKAMSLAKKLTYAETFPSGVVLHGKTGSGFNADYRIGWYVGSFKSGGDEYVFAINFKDTKKPLSKAFAGREAKEMLRGMLK